MSASSSPPSSSSSPPRTRKRARKHKQRSPPSDEFASVPDESSTLPLHPSVYDVVKWDGDEFPLRLYSCPNGSCAFSSLLRACTGEVKADDLPHLRGQLKDYIAAIPAEQWGDASTDFPTPRQYVDHFFGSPDTHVDRSVFQHFLDADSLPVLPHLKPSMIFVIAVQRCNPDADIDEDEDDVKVQSQNVPQVRVVVHKIVRRRSTISPSSPYSRHYRDCVVLYQMTGDAPHHFEAVTFDANGQNHELPLDHPFVHALDQAASYRFIAEAYDTAFVCPALLGWEFPCFLDESCIVRAVVEEKYDNSKFSAIPKVQQLLNNAQGDLNKSDDRFLKYLVSLSLISQHPMTDAARDEEYTKFALFLEEKEPCNVPIVCACMLISFFLHANPDHRRWFFTQNISMKTLATIIVPVMKDNYLLNRLFLTLRHANRRLTRPEVQAMAKAIEHDHRIAHDGWDLDEKGQLVFDIIHSDGSAEGDARVLAREKSTWSVSDLVKQRDWASIVEAAQTRILKLVVNQLGEEVRKRRELSVTFKGNGKDVWWFTAEQIRAFDHQPWIKALEAHEKRVTEEKAAKKRAREEEKMQEDEEEDEEMIRLREELEKVRRELETWKKADAERQKKAKDAARAAEAKRRKELEEKEAELAKERERLERDKAEFEAEKEAWEKNKRVRVEDEVKVNE